MPYFEGIFTYIALTYLCMSTHLEMSCWRSHDSGSITPRTHSRITCHGSMESKDVAMSQKQFSEHVTITITITIFRNMHIYVCTYVYLNVLLLFMNIYIYIYTV